MTENVRIEKVRVDTLKPGDEILRWNGNDSTVCPIDVTWKGKAPEYWADDPKEGGIQLTPDSMVDKVVEQTESRLDSPPKRRLWKFWRR